MRRLNNQEAMNINGGKTYKCPFGCGKRGGYWSVYSHCLLKGCFKKNRYLNALWSGAKWCFSTALGGMIK